jgi:oligoendopeptidase F
MILKKNNRIFLPTDFKIENAAQVLHFFHTLLNEEITSKAQFEIWLEKVSELESVLSEDLAWRYIAMTCDTANSDLQNNYSFFVQEIQPAIANVSHQLNLKIYHSPFTNALASNSAYHLYFSQVKNAIDLFREENIALETQEQTLAQQYSSLMGQLSISYQGNDLTLQQARTFLKNQDRNTREQVYLLIQNAYYNIHKDIDIIFSKLVKIRHQIATNAGFESYTDYKFKALSRIDYTPIDCFDFHNAIQKVVVPLKTNVLRERKYALNLKELKPWDTAVDTNNLPPLKPFENDTDLLDKSINALAKIDPFFGDCLKTMKEMNHLDLGSRKGKAPGGYNYPLAETGVPFIFMNAAGLHRDMETMIHESGHAIHSFLTRDLTLNAFKNTPSEVAELASMTLELLSMDVWSEFYPNENDLRRAQKEKLEEIFTTLPWIATIDAFQHWIYQNPNHSPKQRVDQWNAICDSFDGNIIDYDGLEHFRSYAWQAQLHLFEVPFYYIEYGFAQLGAIAIWKNYISDKQSALNAYKSALKAGYTVGIPNIYALADIQFSSNKKYVESLFNFLNTKYQENCIQ